MTLEVRPQVGGYQEIRLQPPLVPPDLLQISDTDMICDQTGTRGSGGGRLWNMENITNNDPTLSDRALDQRY